MQSVQIGMTKEQIVDIMGTRYQIRSARETTGGRVEEVIVYLGLLGNEYNLIFEDQRLVEWYMTTSLPEETVYH